MSDDIQGWMGIDVIDENCIRLSHDLGWCHMTPEEVAVLIARLGEAVLIARPACEAGDVEDPS